MLRLKPTQRNATTRRRIERALMTLIERKNYERITVAEICEEAAIGRSTFYAHFGGKDEVKRGGLEYVREALITPASLSRDASGPCFGFSLPMLEHARRHVATYRALVRNRGGRVALTKIRAIIADFVRKDVLTLDLPEARRELVVAHVVGAYMSMLTSWLDAGARIAPEHVDATFRQLSIAGIESLRG